MARPLPKYRQVADALAAEISAGRLRSGDQVPSERAIADAMRVSRMTARQALRHLAEQGIVRPQAGQGTFVGRLPIRQDLSVLTSFTEEMARRGRQARSLVVEAGRWRAEPDVARALGLRAGGEVWRIKRVRLMDDEPVAIETTAVVAALTPGLLEKGNWERASLYERLREDYGIRPASADQTLAAALADPSVAAPLGIAPGAAVLRLVRVTRDEEGRAFEHVRSVYRGDLFLMRVRLSLGGADT